MKAIRCKDLNCFCLSKYCLKLRFSNSRISVSLCSLFTYTIQPIVFILHLLGINALEYLADGRNSVGF